MLYPNIATIRGISAVLAITTLVFGTTSSVFAATCIKSRDINYHKLINDQTLELHMNDGTVYRNQMKSKCNGLKFSGYVYRSFSGWFCDYEVIGVLQSPEICALGQFIKLPKGSNGK